MSAAETASAILATLRDDLGAVEAMAIAEALADLVYRGNEREPVEAQAETVMVRVELRPRIAHWLAAHGNTPRDLGAAFGSQLASLYQLRKAETAPQRLPGQEGEIMAVPRALVEGLT